MACNISVNNIKDEGIRSGVKDLSQETQKELDEMKAKAVQARAEK